MDSDIDLLGCEYLGGCPTIGSKVLNKVELHFSNDGLAIAIPTQGLFTLAAAHRALALTWADISVVALSRARPDAPSTAPRRAARSALNVLRMRLDLPFQVTVTTSEWTMNVGVRVAPDQLAPRLQQLLDTCEGPTPIMTAL